MKWPWEIGEFRGIGVPFPWMADACYGHSWRRDIALFVWIGAAQESSMAQMKSSLAGIPVMRAKITDFQTLTPRDPLARATERILVGSQQDFPVVDDGQVVGILTRHDLMVGLIQHGQDTFWLATPCNASLPVSERAFSVL